MPYHRTCTTEAQYIDQVMRKPHSQSDIAEIKRAYFAGHIVQYRRNVNGEWVDLRRWRWDADHGAVSNVSWAPAIRYRIKSGQTIPGTVATSVPLGSLRAGQVGVVVDDGAFVGCIVMATERHETFGEGIAVCLHNPYPDCPFVAGSMCDGDQANMMVRPINFRLEGLE